MPPQIIMVQGADVSMSLCPSAALFVWYSSKHPDTLPKDSATLTLYLRPARYPHRGSMFLTLVVAACEREFNLTPKYDRRRDYERQCLDILEWLHEQGDIESLTVR